MLRLCLIHIYKYLFLLHISALHNIFILPLLRSLSLSSRCCHRHQGYDLLVCLLRCPATILTSSVRYSPLQHQHQSQIHGCQTQQRQPRDREQSIHR